MDSVISKQGAELGLRREHVNAGVAAGFNAPISGVFFAVETVLTKEGSKGNAAWNSSGLTVAMVLLASVLAAIVSQARPTPSPLPASLFGCLMTADLLFFSLTG